MRQLTVILTVLTVATCQMCAGILGWRSDPVNNDTIARIQAQFLVWDGVSHSLSASLEKRDVVDVDWLVYLFHVVLPSPSGGVARHLGRFPVCFRLPDRA